MEMLSRRCSKCRIIRPLPEFSRNKSKRSGYTYECLVCGRVRDAAKRLKEKQFKIAHNTYHPYKSRIKPVTQYTLEGKFIKKFRSTLEANKATGIARTNINRAAAKGRITAGGYLWRYRGTDYNLGEIAFCQCCGKEIDPDLIANISIDCLRDFKKQRDYNRGVI